MSRLLPLLVAWLTCVAGCSVDRFNQFRFSADQGPADLAGDAQGASDMASTSSDMSVSACGERGAPCCAMAPECQGGGCCDRSGTSPVCIPAGAPSPNNSGAVCSGGQFVVCGATADPCCPGDICSDGCCVGGLCGGNGSSCQSGYFCDTTGSSSSCTSIGDTCGGDGDACCVDGSNNFCVASGLACNPVSGNCESCGSDGDLCCDGNACDAKGCCDHSGSNGPRCVGNGNQCGTSGTATCMDSKCGAVCGAPQAACCSGAVGCTAAFTTCETGTCVTCGGDGQKCCKDGASPWCSAGFVCASGTCVACGDETQPCCVGERCDLTKSLTCTSGNCSL